MLVLHALWSLDSRLCVWGEDSARPARAPARRGRAPVRPRPRAHPFAPGASELDSALRRACPALKRSKALAEGELCLLLPSSSDGPQASPHLLRAVDGDAPIGHCDRLDPWVVPAVSLAAVDAVDVLLDLAGAEVPGLAVGDSVRFLAELAKLSLELLARGRVLPTLVRRQDRWVAAWEPVTVDPADGDRVRLLTGAMPPLLRAQAGSPETAPSAEAVLSDVLGALLDACARSFLAGRLGGRGRRRSRPAAEAWLAALTDADPAVPGDERALAELAEQLEGWRAAMERYAAHRMFRTCFRLWAPEEPAWRPDGGSAPAAGGSPVLAGEAWRVEILHAGQGRSERARARARGLERQRPWAAHPRPPDRGSAGAAARRTRPCTAPVARAGAGAAGVRADRRDARRRRRVQIPPRSAPALEQAGFGVLAPPWWNKRLRLKLNAEPFKEFEEGSGLFGLDGLCAYEWRIAVGDATLSVTELRELAALKLPLVMSRGAVDRAAPRGRRGGAAVLRGTLGAWRGARRGTSARDARARRAAAAEHRRPRSRAPGGSASCCARTVRARCGRSRRRPPSRGSCGPTSSAGWPGWRSSQASGLGACLADDMGLGKTPQTLALLLAERDASSGRPHPQARLRRPCSICPMSVVGNWQREAQRFAPSLRVLVHHGPERLGARVRARRPQGGPRDHDATRSRRAIGRRSPPSSGSALRSTRRRTSRRSTRSRPARSARCRPATGSR